MGTPKPQPQLRQPQLHLLPVPHNRLRSRERATARARGLGRLGAPGRGGDVWQRRQRFQTYPEGTAWELHYHSLDDVGANMAEFAIASLSTLALQNARLTLPGARPRPASYLVFDW